MTGNRGRDLGRGPAVSVDHVLVPVVDLEQSMVDFASRHGLRVLPGGRHPGVGTANALVPLGSTYIELIGVVDDAEAATSARSLRIRDAARAGRPYATWAARPVSMADARARLEGAGFSLPPPQPGARGRPDGVRLEWTTQELAPPEQASVLPFLIEWRVPEGDHPAANPPRQPSGAGDIRELHFTARDPAEAVRLLGAVVDDAVDFEVMHGDRDELVRIVLEGPRGGIWIP